MVDDQMKKLQSNGLKITPQRRLILDILGVSSHLTGEEIINKARLEQPHISAGTVYRNLNRLCEIGLVRKVAAFDGASRFESTAFHRHHFFCLSCHDAVEIDFCPMNEEVRNLAGLNGFEVVDHDFKINGYCQKCKKGGSGRFVQA
ncbi:MAG TPA: transcriptional repressor [Syntrophomonadaceae bacterium]|nr:transcriptional repressor [Syntrophomonadaceae bacterium]